MPKEGNKAMPNQTLPRGLFSLAPGFEYEASYRAEGESIEDFHRFIQDQWISLDQVDDALNLSIHGVVGATNPGPVLRLIKQQPYAPINVSLNSPGGFVGDGVEIYRALVDHAGPVSVSVNGYAASAASFIAAAADTLAVPAGGLVMVHNAWLIAVGDKKDLAKQSDILAKFDQSIALIYSNAWGGDTKEWLDLMAEETWFNSVDAEEKLGANQPNEDATIVLNTPNSEPDFQALADARARRSSITKER